VSKQKVTRHAALFVVPGHLALVHVLDHGTEFRVVLTRRVRHGQICKDDTALVGLVYYSQAKMFTVTVAIECKQVVLNRKAVSPSR